MEGNYKLRLVRGNTEFEAAGDKKFVLEMASRFESLLNSPTSAIETTVPKDTASTKASTSLKNISAREFLQKTGVKRHSDIVLSFGYYLENHLGKKEFTAADINNCYYEAKLETTNTSQSLINNIKRSFLMEARANKGAKKSGRKSYTLTSSGESFIEKKLEAKPK